MEENLFNCEISTSRFSSKSLLSPVPNIPSIKIECSGIICSLNLILETCSKSIERGNSDEHIIIS